MRGFVKALHRLDAAMLERPELRGERARGRLQQRRQINMIGAEAHAEFAQARPAVLIEAAHLVRHPGAIQHAERFGDLEGDAAPRAFEPVALFEVGQRAEPLGHELGEPGVEPGLHLVQRRARQLLVGQHLNARFEQLVAARQLADDLAEPAHGPVIGEREGVVDGLMHALGAGLDLARQSLLRRGVQRLGRLARGLRVRREAESLQLADMLTFDRHLSGGGDLSIEHLFLSQATQQHARPAIDEPLGEPLVQGVRQPVLYLTRRALPMRGIMHPIGTIGDIGPGAHMRQAPRQRVDVPFDAVGRVELIGEPGVRDAPGAHHESVDRQRQIGVGGG